MSQHLEKITVLCNPFIFCLTCAVTANLYQEYAIKQRTPWMGYKSMKGHMLFQLTVGTWVLRGNPWKHRENMQTPPKTQRHSLGGQVTMILWKYTGKAESDYCRTAWYYSLCISQRSSDTNPNGHKHCRDTWNTQVPRSSIYSWFLWQHFCSAAQPSKIMVTSSAKLHTDTWE